MTGSFRNVWMVPLAWALVYVSSVVWPGEGAVWWLAHLPGFWAAMAVESQGAKIVLAGIAGGATLALIGWSIDWLEVRPWWWIGVALLAAGAGCAVWGVPRTMADCAAKGVLVLGGAIVVGPLARLYVEAVRSARARDQHRRRARP